MDRKYDVREQTLYLQFIISNRDLAARCNNILDPDHFDRKIRKAAEFIKSYISQHGDIPDPLQIKAVSSVDIENIGAKAIQHSAWFLEDFEKFSRYKALEKAILTSSDLLDKHEYGAVEKLIKDAVQVGLPKTFGTDYFADPVGRLKAIRDNNGQVSTGWKDLDDKLYGGFNKGELNIFAGASGAGKSLFLQNLALNWTQRGMNTVYFSLELSELLCSQRMDAMLTDMSTRDLYKRLDEVELKVKSAGKKGKLQIVQLTNGVTPNDLLAWIREFQTQRDIKVDAILVDYLDLMMPAGQKISVSDMFVKDKLVAEELRNLVVTENLLLATASQLNRSAVESVEFDHSMIAGGLSKIQTADNVFGIYSTPSMKERGTVQIQFMKTRSSSGVGHKIDLSFNPDTMRISDAVDSGGGSTTTRASDVYDKVRARSNLGTTVNTEAPTPPASTKWEKPTGTHAWDYPTGGATAVNETEPVQKPLATPVATSANRNALRAIVSREI